MYKYTGSWGFAWGALVRCSSTGSFKAAQEASEALLTPFGEVLACIMCGGNWLTRRMGWTLLCIEDPSIDRSVRRWTPFGWSFLHNKVSQPDGCKYSQRMHQASNRTVYATTFQNGDYSCRISVWHLLDLHHPCVGCRVLPTQDKECKLSDHPSLYSSP